MADRKETGSGGSEKEDGHEVKDRGGGSRGREQAS